MQAKAEPVTGSGGKAATPVMHMDLERFRRLPLMGILRGGSVDVIEPLVEAVVGAGLETLEVAMNTPDAPAIIARACQVAGDALMVGAGTVTTLERLEVASAAGAGFVVMPTFEADIVARCRAQGVPVFPGALTPQEIFDAWRAGATMVKLFPAGLFGPDYVREIRGPFDDIELLACGGVNADNMATFFSSGAAAVAFGGSVFKEDRLLAGDFELIGTAVARLVATCRAVVKG